MANNRLCLVCNICCPADYWKWPNDNVFVLAKYFPSTGYYTNRPDNESFNEWLEKHRHDGQDHIYRMQYEIEKMVDSQAKALWNVVQAAEELCKRADLMCGYKRMPGDPPALIQLKDLELALAALKAPSSDTK